MMTRTLRIAIPLSLAVLFGTASAADIWSSSAITGIPHVDSGWIRTVHTSGPHGLGVRLASGFVGEAYIYLPVNMPPGTTFTGIRLRAEGHAAPGWVKAELMRQTLPGNGPYVIVGNVDTVGNGFQKRHADFAPHITSGLNSYYIRITLFRSELAADPKAYDVVLNNE